MAQMIEERIEESFSRALVSNGLFIYLSKAYLTATVKSRVDCGIYFLVGT
jgi:hypothetical protein